MTDLQKAQEEFRLQSAREFSRIPEADQKTIPSMTDFYVEMFDDHLVGFDAYEQSPKFLKMVEVIKFYANEDNHNMIIENLSLPIGQVKNITSSYKEDAGAKARDLLREMNGE